MPARPPSLSGHLFGPLFAGLYSLYAAVVFGINTFLLFCPVIILAGGVERRRRIAAFGVRLGLFAMAVPFRVLGSERLPAGPCIVVSNHASYVDGLVLTAALPPRFTFVVQHGVASWPYAGLVLRKLDYRFVNRVDPRQGAVQTRGLLRDLRRGESLAVFAEGTFVKEPGLMAFKNGAFMMAAKAGLPVVPVAIRGSRRLLGAGRWRFRRSPITVEFGEPIAPTLAAADLRDAARAQVLSLCGEPDRLPASHAAPAAGPPAPQTEAAA